MSTPTASSPVYMMLTHPSFEASTNSDIRAYIQTNIDAVNQFQVGEVWRQNAIKLIMY